MKKLLLYAITLAVAFPALAELEGNGYYRVQNAYTKRYCYLRDNRGSYDKVTTTADVAALHLYKGLDRAISDPSSVFYVSKAPTGEYKYDIAGQGTSIHSFMDMYLDIRPDRKPYDGIPCYNIYATDSGVVRYLGDVRGDMNNEKGMASVDAIGDDRKWYFDPLNAETDQYFGILPTVEANDRYYYPLYAAFPFSAYSEGVKFYVIDKIDARGAAVLKEITGTVPASTPVIVECSSPYVWGNKLNVGGTAVSGVASGNLLKGVYFDNSSVTHYNRTAYNKQTMRLLGVKDGHLAFVEGNIDFLPANQAYLQLTAVDQYATQDFVVMTPEQYDETMAVSVIPVSSTVDVYGLDGCLVKSGILKEDVPSLGKGLYILRSGNITEKLIVR